MEEKSIAMEIVQELKVQNERLSKANERLSRIIKYLLILCIILIIIGFGSNIAWLVYESQYEYVTTDTITTQDIDDADLDNTSVIQY